MVKKYSLIAIAALVYALGVGVVLEPAHLVTGGVTGMGIVFNYVTGVGTGTWILLLNIPILIVGAMRFGKRFIASTVYFIVMSSVFTDVIAVFVKEPILTDPLLVAVAGGSLTATGMGWALRNGATSGGIDIIVKLIRRRRPHMKTSTLIFLMDIVIVGVGALVLQDLEKTLYAAVSVATTSYVLDLVLYGKDEARQYLVISDKSGEIAARLLEELHTGVTYLTGQGAFSSRGKQILLCVVRKPRSSKLEGIVRDTDPQAFLIVSNATRIYGEGYKSFFGESF